MSTSLNPLVVVGKRSDIVKLGPVLEELREKGVSCALVDIGEYKGWFMKGAHYLDFDFPNPDFSVKTTGESAIWQLFEIISSEEPTHILVAGSSVSAYMAALASATLRVPLVHVEAGYRTYDLSDEEEVRREVIDALSSVCYAPTKATYENLLAEGNDRSRVILTGSTVLDSVMRHLELARAHSTILDELDLRDEPYCVVTLHKGRNTTNGGLRELFKAISDLKEDYFVMPLHPNAKEVLKVSGLYEEYLTRDNLLLVEPLSHVDFLALVDSSRLVITDSGTVCEEAVILNKPVVSINEETRIDLIREGYIRVTELVSSSIVKEVRASEHVRVNRMRVAKLLGYGLASEKVAEHLYRTCPSYGPRVTCGGSDRPPRFEVVDLGEEVRKARSKLGDRIVSFVSDGRLVRDEDEIAEKALIISG